MTTVIELSVNQKKIVYAENGPIYVKAVAGSGKTRVLTERLRHLLTQTTKKILEILNNLFNNIKKINQENKNGCSKKKNFTIKTRYATISSCTKNGRQFCL